MFPLAEELSYVSTAFPGLTTRRFFSPSTKNTTYDWMVPPDGRFTMAACSLPQMGNTFAVDTVNRMIHDLEPTLVICVGIAGAVSDDFLVGDVAIADRVFDIANAAKIVDRKPSAPRNEDGELATAPKDAEDELLVKLEAHPFKPDAELVNLIVNWKRSVKYSRWRTDQHALFRRLITFDRKRPAKAYKQFFRETPTIQSTSFSTGFVLASNLLREKLPSRREKIVETEGAGVGLACSSSETPFIVIRGVSDLADAAKSGLEKVFKSANRRLALNNAFSSFVALAKEPWFYEWLNERRSTSTVKGIIPFGFSSVATDTPRKAASTIARIHRDLQKASASTYSVQAEHSESFWRVFPSLTLKSTSLLRDVEALLLVLRRYAVWSSMLADSQSADAVCTRLKEVLETFDARLSAIEVAWCHGAMSHVLLRAGRLPEAADTLRAGLRRLRDELEGEASRDNPAQKSTRAQLLLSQKCLNCMSAELLDAKATSMGKSMIRDVESLQKRRRSLGVVKDRDLDHDDFYFEMVKAKISLWIQDGRLATAYAGNAKRSLASSIRSHQSTKSGHFAGGNREDVGLEKQISKLYELLAKKDGAITSSILKPAQRISDAIKGLDGQGFCWLRLNRTIRDKIGI